LGEGCLLLRGREGKEWEKGRKGMARGKGERKGEGGKGRGGREGEGRHGSTLDPPAKFGKSSTASHPLCICSPSSKIGSSPLRGCGGNCRPGGK